MAVARVAAIAALVLLCGTSVLGRDAPAELCYADVRRGDRGPGRPLGPVLGLEARDLASRVSVSTQEVSRGCALALLDVAEAALPTPPRPAAVVDVGWLYYNGSCMIPLAYRQYFNCAGGALPSPAACADYSETRLRGGYGTSDYALYGTSLVMRPGLYDSGEYVYVLGYDATDVRVGSVTLAVGSDVYKYPCGLDRGIGVALGHKSGSAMRPAEPRASDDWARGCFPEPVEVNVEWGAVSAAELGLAPLDEDAEDEDDRDPDLTDCRTRELFGESDMFMNATGSESLLVGAVAKDVLAVPLHLPPGESYETLRNASLEYSARPAPLAPAAGDRALLPLPVAARPEGRFEYQASSRALGAEFGLFGLLPEDEGVRRGLFLGFAAALIVLLATLIAVIICACRLACKVKAYQRTRAAAGGANPSYGTIAHV
ncbi:Envelope glycoprotein G [Caprine alphaherpesvirus 1]|uniref:Envelope glycoprotein G n=1 Tax=Caprine alphaherpesvirus 1 TaxID=39944 RepID=A0AAE6D0F7_9ALPH|nr:Envelope glycoprotein G [Caprine alphaherpesvirus 1]QBM10907.1 Envelope glycoprotein G [Caprine alphaherpesvirus 1]